MKKHFCAIAFWPKEIIRSIHDQLIIFARTFVQRSCDTIGCQYCQGRKLRLQSSNMRGTNFFDIDRRVDWLKGIDWWVDRNAWGQGREKSGTGDDNDDSDDDIAAYWFSLCYA
ncbi:unnamed protein product [Brugia pahangi]|uniref:Integrase_SAM-like_N domain-containing protein n=1 Tax=Brugia pahangi TaxID=6280 RepID=A0A0N4TWC4_BRUPA|nr:unnamed protein product [Brugia pahangi]